MGEGGLVGFDVKLLLYADSPYLSLLFFPYETLDLVCFYAFLYFSGIELPFVHNRVDGLGACFPGKI